MVRQPSVANLFITALIIVIIAQIGCMSEPVINKRMSEKALIARLNGIARLIGGEDKATARGAFDFITDPSLAVTILHTLEVAYWTLPMGFLLMPIINFFRIPNRRSGRSESGRGMIVNKENLRRTLDRFYTILNKAIDEYDRLSGKEQRPQAYGRPQIQIVGTITPQDNRSL